MKTRRKDYDQFNDDFSDFSLSSPARKTRRLNAELPPIMEEDEHPEIAMLSDEHCIQESQDSLPFSECGSDSVGGDLSISENQERSIILFKPVNEHLFQASTVSSPFSVTVDSDLISGYKYEFFRAGHTLSDLIAVEDDDRLGNEAENATNGCMAVIPWVPSQILPYQIMIKPLESETAMDIEQNNDESPIEGGQLQSHEYGGMTAAWHQQHCMIPQLPQTTSAPITWFH